MAADGMSKAEAEEDVDRQIDSTPVASQESGMKSPVSVAFSGMVCDNIEHGHTQTTGW